MNLPPIITLKGYDSTQDFHLTDKRELHYHGRTKDCNQHLDRVEKLKDNEVWYETTFGWGVFLNTCTMETVTYDGTEWGGQKINLFHNH